MSNTITQQWILDRLALLNGKEIERRSDMKHGRIHDVKRGKAKFNDTELHKLTLVLSDLQFTE